MADCSVQRDKCTAPHLNSATSGFPYNAAITFSIPGSFANKAALTAFNKVCFLFNKAL